MRHKTQLMVFQACIFLETSSSPLQSRDRHQLLSAHAHLTAADRLPYSAFRAFAVATTRSRVDRGPCSVTAFVLLKSFVSAQDVLPPDELAALLASPHRPNYCLGVRAGILSVTTPGLLNSCGISARSACTLHVSAPSMVGSQESVLRQAC